MPIVSVLQSRWLGMVLVALLPLTILLFAVFKVGSVALPPAGWTA